MRLRAEDDDDVDGKVSSGESSWVSFGKGIGIDRYIERIREG